MTFIALTFISIALVERGLWLASANKKSLADSLTSNFIRQISNSF